MTLNSQETRALVDHLHTNELQTIMQHRYSNPIARTQDIQWCNQAYEEAIHILEAESNEALPEAENETLQQQIWSAARSSIRFSYEQVKNFKLRSEYIVSLGNLTRAEINMSSSQNGADVISKNTADLDSILEYWGNGDNASLSAIWSSQIPRAASDSDTSLDTETSILKGISNQAEPTVAGPIAAESSVAESLSSIGVVGAAIALFTLGVMIWKIKDNTNMALNATQNAVNLGAGIAGGLVGAEIGGEGGLIVGPEGAIIGALLGGIICSFASGVAANNIFNAVVEAFGNPQSSELSGKLFGPPILYELQLPDNMALSMAFTENLKGT